MTLNALCLIILLCSCSRGGLYVQQEWIDRSFLASSKLLTPDPRQEDPPFGQRLIVSWSIAPEEMAQSPQVVARVRRWNQKEEIFQEEVTQRRKTIAFFLEEKNAMERILTYRVDLVGEGGKPFASWEHHLWTEQILPSLWSKAMTSEELVSQSRQESVTETP